MATSSLLHPLLDPTFGRIAPTYEKVVKSGSRPRLWIGDRLLLIDKPSRILKFLRTEPGKPKPPYLSIPILAISRKPDHK